MVNVIILIALLNSRDTEWWFFIMVGLFWALCLVIGISILVLFFRKLSSGPLLLGTDFIELPGRWKSKTRIRFDEIEEVHDFDTYGPVLELSTTRGVYLIERKWMKKIDFEYVKKHLDEFIERG